MNNFGFEEFETTEQINNITIKQKTYQNNPSIDEMIEKHHEWIQSVDLLDGEQAKACYSNMRHVQMINKELSYSKFNHSDFTFANLRNTNFTGAELRRVSFNQANLSFVNFNNADLRGSKFRNCKLYKTNFNNAKLENVEFYP